MFPTALFTIRTNPRWQPPPCWKNFKWRYLCNRSSHPEITLCADECVSKDELPGDEDLTELLHICLKIIGLCRITLSLRHICTQTYVSKLCPYLRNCSQRRYLRFEQIQDGSHHHVGKISSGDISATSRPIHFMVCSRVGFSGTAYLMALFPVRTNPKWRPPPSWKNFKWPYLCNRSSDPLHVWL